MNSGDSIKNIIKKLEKEKYRQDIVQGLHDSEHSVCSQIIKEEKEDLFLLLFKKGYEQVFNLKSVCKIIYVLNYRLFNHIIKL